MSILQHFFDLFGVRIESRERPHGIEQISTTANLFDRLLQRQERWQQRPGKPRLPNRLAGLE